MPRVLILGGTAEARQLAERLASRSGLDVTLSLAGRTAAPARQPVPVRSGGFGGAAGLADYLIGERIGALIDATHPYASVISANAVAAAREANVPLVALRRSPWIAVAGDRWIEVSDAAEAVRAGRPRAVSSSHSAARSWRRSRERRSTAILSAASIRSIRRCPCRT
jgi:precorrin-6A/cobalt-precorrin-6A reductase